MKVLGNKILITVEEPSETNSSGLYIPEDQSKKYRYANVVEVGEGTEKDPMKVSKGDRIMVTVYAGTPITHDDVDYRVIDQSDVLVIL